MPAVVCIIEVEPITHSEEQLLKALASGLLLTRKWSFAANDPGAVAQLTNRIQTHLDSNTQPGLAKSPISYDNVAYQIDFTRRDGTLFQIDIDKWSAHQGTMLGEYLDYISLTSLAHNATLLSAHVVQNKSRRPGDGFYKLCADIGLLSQAASAQTQELFWQTERGFLLNPSTVSQRVIPFDG